MKRHIVCSAKLFGSRRKSHVIASYFEGLQRRTGRFGATRYRAISHNLIRGSLRVCLYLFSTITLPTSSKIVRRNLWIIRYSLQFNPYQLVILQHIRKYTPNYLQPPKHLRHRINLQHQRPQLEKPPQNFLLQMQSGKYSKDWPHLPRSSTLPEKQSQYTQ